MRSDKPTIHLLFLKVLYLLSVKIRKGGLIAIEPDIEDPEDTSSLLSGHPELRAYPQHFNFMLDMLRLGLNGYGDVPLLTLFSSTARKAFQPSSREDEVLWDCIFSTLMAMFSGVDPIFSVEFGRQAIPYEDRPSFLEAEEFMKMGAQHANGAQGQEGSESWCRIETQIDELYRKMDAGH